MNCDLYEDPVNGLMIRPSEIFPTGIHIGDRLLLSGGHTVTVITWEEAKAEHLGDTGWDAPMSEMYIRYDEKTEGRKCWGCMTNFVKKIVDSLQEDSGQLLMF